MDAVRERIEGVVIGVLMGVDGGRPMVVFPGNLHDAAIAARSLAPLDHAPLGAEVALLFEGGDPRLPLIVGRIVQPGGPGGAQVEPEGERLPVEPDGERIAVQRDGERVRIVAGERLELRCGRATILMERDGRITIRGAQVVSHASGANRIRGGSVHLN